MAFTCPDCLWTSHHPMDEKHGFCGHCRTYPTGGNLNPTPFQADAIRALRGEAPARSLVAVVRLEAAKGVPLTHIWFGLGPLVMAEKVTTAQRDVMRLMFAALRMVQEARAELADLEVLDEPSDPPPVCR